MRHLPPLILPPHVPLRVHEPIVRKQVIFLPARVLERHHDRDSGKFQRGLFVCLGLLSVGWLVLGGVGAGGTWFLPACMRFLSPRLFRPLAWAVLSAFPACLTPPPAVLPVHLPSLAPRSNHAPGTTLKYRPPAHWAPQNGSGQVFKPSLRFDKP